MWKISTLTFCLRFLSHQNGLTNYFDFLIPNIIPGGERGGVQITCTMACEKNLRSEFHVFGSLPGLQNLVILFEKFTYG